MIRLDVFPARAQFRPGEAVELRAAVSGPPSARIQLEGTVFELGRPISGISGGLDLDRSGNGETVIETAVSPFMSGHSVGYAVELRASDGSRSATSTTAFDVADHWSQAPRYGFLSDFNPEEPAEESRRRLDTLLQLHVNVIQFYDWMATHHTFLAPSDEFTDTLGRRLSHAVVRRKIDLGHERGMAAIAYGALYGAERDFSESRPELLLYDGRGVPISLADLFYLQDFSEASPWRSWILAEYEQAVDVLGFDGIHIDQYGCPKQALSRVTGAWRTFDAAQEFPGFVEEAGRRVLGRRPEGGSIFNCVNAWPLEAMADVASDAATYIEVWDPHSTYRELYELVRRAREIRPSKQVILAAYLLPFSPAKERTPGALTAFCLASAAIHAGGGFHLLAGEGASLLTEAYYPRYGLLDDHEYAVVRRYYDFIVRSTALLHQQDGHDIAWTQVGTTNDVITLHHPDLEEYGAGARPGALWVIAHKSGGVTSLQVINLRGIASDKWNVAHESPPAAIESVELRIATLGGISEAWWDTPDDDVGRPRPLSVTVLDEPDGRFARLRIPRIDIWTAVWWVESEWSATPSEEPENALRRRSC